MSSSIHRLPGPLSFVAALVAVGLISFVCVRALDSGASSATSSVAAPAPFVPLAEYAERSPHVDSALNVIGVQGAVRGESATPSPDQVPLSPRSFERPVAEYLAYSVAQLGLMEGEVATLRSALAAGDRVASQAAWRVAFARYLQLGAVYLEGSVATLNQEIDGGAGGLQGGTSSPQFTGLHRIELGLWTGQSPAGLVPYASLLETDVHELRAALPHVQITPLEYATRAHEILEDAVRDLLSGTDVPWSGEGVLGTAAGLAATREVIATLKPLLRLPAAQAADPPANPRSPAVADADLDVLQGVLNSLAAAHGGQYPTNQELSQAQAERLDAAIGQALEGLSQLPGMLETTLPPAVASIPASAVRIDP